MSDAPRQSRRIHRALRALAMQIPAIRRVVEEKREAQRQLALLKNASTYLQLEGTAYSRYALPLEYPPSRDMRPRWGYSRPLIPTLLSWFESHAEDYRAFIADMRRYGRELQDVPRTLDAARLPTPAWMGRSEEHTSE